MNTQEIMDLANRLAGFDETPLDSTIYVPGEGVEKILIGIDIGAGELTMAKQLGYDLVIAHHPVSLSGKHRVYKGHIDLMVKAGVPEDVARKAVDVRYESLALVDQVGNHDQVSSAAELLAMPFMNIHQPCDEIGRAIMQKTVDAQLEAKPDSTLQDVVDALTALPEYETAQVRPMILMGEPGTKAGKTRVAHGVYTSGGAAIAKAYFDHGTDTVIYIHTQAPELAQLRKTASGNLISSGHIPSDEIGINPLIDALRDKGLTVDCISGLRLRRRHYKIG